MHLDGNDVSMGVFFLLFVRREHGKWYLRVGVVEVRSEIANTLEHCDFDSNHKSLKMDHKRVAKSEKQS